MFKTGDTCYFLESNRRAVEGTIRSCSGGNYIVKYGQENSI